MYKAKVKITYKTDQVMVWQWVGVDTSQAAIEAKAWQVIESFVYAKLDKFLRLPQANAEILGYAFEVWNTDLLPGKE